MPLFYPDWSWQPECLPLSQKELAEFFGVTRPSLARALGEMEKEGIIDVKRREIQINNKKKLIEIIE